MSTLINPTTIFHHRSITKTISQHRQNESQQPPKTSIINTDQSSRTRRNVLSTLLAGSAITAAGLNGGLSLAAEGDKMKWGTRSFLWEHFFEPSLSPEDAAARIKNTAEGFHGLKQMVDTMSWRYLIFYIRLKAAYLKQDLKGALPTVASGQRQDYVNKANELIDNMAEFDYYVRTPKVFESYVFYLKSVKSLDEVAALLA